MSLDAKGQFLDLHECTDGVNFLDLDEWPLEWCMVNSRAGPPVKSARLVMGPYCPECPVLVIAVFLFH